VAVWCEVDTAEVCWYFGPWMRGMGENGGQRGDKSEGSKRSGGRRSLLEGEEKRAEILKRRGRKPATIYGACPRK